MEIGFAAHNQGTPLRGAPNEPKLVVDPSRLRSIAEVRSVSPISAGRLDRS